MEKIPTCTSYKNIPYDKPVFSGVRLDVIVQDLHEYDCSVNSYEYSPLKKGCYSYDNLATCVSDVYDKFVNTTDNMITDAVDMEYDIETEYLHTIDKIAAHIHKSSGNNYMYWKYKEPWLNTEYGYQKPNNPLGDARRDKYAVTSYYHLPQDEKLKDIILAEYLYKLL
jgi:hypothetical protein